MNSNPATTMGREDEQCTKHHRHDDRAQERRLPLGNIFAAVVLSNQT
jgi:hypothetical protein